MAEALRNGGHTVKQIDPSGAFLTQIDQFGADVVFVALHGTFGEDGQVQRILEDHGIPYTGSGVRASRFAMDKVVAKKEFVRAGVPTPRWRILAAPCSTEELHNTEKALGFPLVVKPVAEGSSLGISLVRSKFDWASALQKACLTAAGDDPLQACVASGPANVLVEEYIAGRELTVAVMEGSALPVIEVTYQGDLFDFNAKYTKGLTRYDDAPVLEAEVEAEVKAAAAQAYKCLNCRGVARVDLMLSEHNVPYVLEVNTIPGMTATSLVPKAARRAGMEFEELTSRIVQEGLAAHRQAAVQRNAAYTDMPDVPVSVLLQNEMETFVGETRGPEA